MQFPGLIKCDSALPDVVSGLETHENLNLVNINNNIILIKNINNNNLLLILTNNKIKIK